MSDTKKCHSCGQLFFNADEYNAHRNGHIRGEITSHKTLPGKEKILEKKIRENIKSLKIETPVVPGQKDKPNAPSLPDNPMQQPQQPIYNPQQYYPPQQQPIPQTQQVAPQIPQMQPQASPPPQKPIALKYVYEGTCPQDNTEVMTIETDVGNDHYVMAICPTCQRQWQNRKVVKLDRIEQPKKVIKEKKEKKAKK